MFHGRPLNQSGVFVPPTSQPQQQQSWPLTQQEHNNLRASQSGSSPSVQVKFYLPDDEIRRSQIPANCTLQQVTEQIKRYASVADKNLLLAWNDDQNEWIRFDTDSEFNDAMNHARHLLSVNGVFKIQAKEGKTPTKQTTSEPTPVVEQKPIQQPVQPVVQPVQPVQPPIQQPVQPVKPPVTQPPVTQPPVVQPIKPVQPVNPFYPQQPMYTQPPVMSYGQPQPQFQPFAMNPPMMNQPMTQPMTQASTVPRNVSPFATSTPTKTLNNSVTMQQPHPLNSSFSSSSSSVPSQSPVQQLPVNPPLTQPQVVQPQQTANVDEQKLATLRSFGFPVNDSVLIKALQEANGDINLAVAKMLEQ